MSSFWGQDYRALVLFNQGAPILPFAFTKQWEGTVDPKEFSKLNGPVRFRRNISGQLVEIVIPKVKIGDTPKTGAPWDQTLYPFRTGYKHHILTLRSSLQQHRQKHQHVS
jgi:hypothetical protein